MAGEIVAQRFEIVGLAGSGAMGRVYKAFDLQLGRHVALKLMDADAPSARFEREAEVLAGLDHPSIVRHVAHGFSGAELFLAMDWLEGEDLAGRLARGPLTSQETLVVAAQAAAALGAAHAHGVIHRDVKPGNLVLVNGSLAELRLVDFGLAAVHASTRGPLTQVGSVLGTAGYMAPEQVRSDSELDARADVFSLGCVLFECLAGRCPFEGETPLAILAKILLEDAPRVSELSPTVPEVLDDLVARMLRKPRDDRPENGAALAEIIAGLVRSDPRTWVPAKAASLTRLERRLVSVVCLRERLSAPEALAAAAPEQALARAPTLLDMSAVSVGAGPTPQLQAIRAVAQRFAGGVEPLPDGSVVIIHDAREGSADPTERAARTALALRDLFPGMTIALATGQSTTGKVRTIGGALDRAATLLSKGTPETGVRIDEISVGLLEARFELASDAHGPLLACERAAARAERTLLGRQTPCVGREPVLSTLLGMLDATVARREPHAALISAAAGVGKSRLRYEFLRRSAFRCPEATIWVGWGDPMGAGSPFGLLAPLIRRVLGVGEMTSPAERRGIVLERVALSVASIESLRVAEFIGELIGVQFPDEARLQLRAARNDALLMGDQMLRAWGDFVEAHARTRPVVLVVEDIHWGDWPSLRFIESAMARSKGLPLFVLALGRPELRSRFPGLWSERSVTTIELCELAPDASRAIIASALGQADEALIGQLVERAAGNPFYLEELIRAVVDGRGISLPGAVLAVAQARLEGLADAQRRVLRAGSVFGASFLRGGVMQLLAGDSEGEVDALLAALTEQEILCAAGDREESDGSDSTYAFRHAILRDAAYSMLTPEDCALGHRLAGAWLERRADCDPLVLAEHFERGATPERAGVWYRRAAEQALEGNDFAAVAARVDSAFRCGLSGIEAGRVHLVAAEALRWSSDNAGAARHGCAAMALLERGSLPWFSAAGEAANALGRLGRFSELDQLATELDASARLTPSPAVLAALARTSDQLLFAGEHAHYRSLVTTFEALTAGREDDPVVETWLIYVRAGVAMMTDSGEYVREMRALVASFEGLGDTRNACLQRVNLADAYIHVGLHAEAASLSRETLAESTELGLAMTAVNAKCNLARALGELGDLVEARSLAAEVALGMHLAQDHRMEAAARGVLSRVLRKSGELQSAEDAARGSLTLSGTPLPTRSLNLARLAEVLLTQGRFADALPVATEAFELLVSLGTIDEGEAFVRLIHAEALLAAGRDAAGRASLAQAHALLMAKASTMSSSHFRSIFLTKVEENARTLSLHEQLTRSS